jgi:hypothetical protein
MRIVKYGIDEDTGLCRDDGPFRSYRLQCCGDTFEEMWADAFIWEIDQDGGDHEGYHPEEYGAEVERVCRDMILAEIRRTDAEEAMEKIGLGVTA